MEFFDKRFGNLHKAAQYDNIERMEKLIEAGADVNAVDQQGATPLFYTANKGSVPAARLLLNHGANILHTTSGGGTALHSALLKSHIDLALFLIENGADIHQPTQVGVTALHVAANKGLAQAVEELIQRGAEINGFTQVRQTPLLLAMAGLASAFHEGKNAEGEEATVRLLFKLGADPSLDGKQAETFPLSLVELAMLTPQSQAIAYELIEQQFEKPQTGAMTAYLVNASKTLYDPPTDTNPEEILAQTSLTDLQLSDEEKTTPLGRYLLGLQRGYGVRGIDFFGLVHGASKEDVENLLQAYPDTPASLIRLLSYIDGTAYRKYSAQEITLPIFDGETSYRLQSAQKMLALKDSNRSIAWIYGDSEEEAEELQEVLGQGVDGHAPFSKRLHFSDCINNGGSSSLYIDFAPADDGVVGQILRWVHDPDYYDVIAKNFDEFLTQQVERGFAFIENDEDFDDYGEHYKQWERIQPFYASLRENNADSLEYLKNHLDQYHILTTADQAPTPAVLNIYLHELRRLYAIRDDIAPSGYPYQTQYDYLARNFLEFHEVWEANSNLAKEVHAFAKEVQYQELLEMFKK